MAELDNLDRIPKFMLGDDVHQEFNNTAARLATITKRNFLPR
ncbi:hypothetical protein AAHH67_15100 [Niallia circulans]